jgi:hypothetical protein
MNVYLDNNVFVYLEQNKITSEYLIKMLNIEDDINFFYSYTHIIELYRSKNISTNL